MSLTSQARVQQAEYAVNNAMAGRIPALEAVEFPHDSEAVAAVLKARDDAEKAREDVDSAKAELRAIAEEATTLRARLDGADPAKPLDRKLALKLAEAEAAGDPTIWAPRFEKLERAAKDAAEHAEAVLAEHAADILAELHDRGAELAEAWAAIYDRELAEIDAERDTLAAVTLQLLKRLPAYVPEQPRNLHHIQLEPVPARGLPLEQTTRTATRRDNVVPAPEDVQEHLAAFKPGAVAE